MNSSAWVEIAVIMAITLYNQMGIRKINLFRIIVPIAIALLVGNKYIHAIPMEGSNMAALFIIVIAGVLFGGMLLVTTKVGQDPSGTYYTQAGIPYLIVWILEVGSRLAFANYAQQHPTAVGHFFISHQLSPEIIGPAFILMTVTMLVVRVVGILWRAKLFPAKQAMQ
jgi:hypothetical protein